MLTLQNEYLKATFDEKGRMLGLEDIGSGRGNILAAPCENLFRLVYRQGENWENVADGRFQTFTAEQKGQTVTFRTASLKTRKSEAAVALCLTIRLEGEKLFFEAQIDNREEDCLITDFEYPCIGRIKTLCGGKPALLWPYQAGLRYHNIAACLMSQDQAPDGFHRVLSRENGTAALCGAYPGGLLSMQWMALEDQDEILYLGGHDDQFYTCEMCVRGDADRPDTVTLVFDRMPFVKSGECWQSPQTVLMHYRGSWRHGADEYKEWASSWFPTHAKPQWIKDMLGYYLVIMKQQYGTEMWKYEDLPYLYEKAKAAGCDTLGLFGWYESGHDNQYPDLEVSESMGGRQSLIDNMRKVQEQGGHLTLYQQGHLIDIGSEYYRKGGHRFEIKGKDGFPYYEQYNKAHQSGYLRNYTFKTFTTACPSCPEWQDLMVEKTDWAASFGPDGVLFDQIGGLAPRPCFDDRHPHPLGKPSLAVSHGRRTMMDQMQQESKKLHPEYAFMTEILSDAYGGYPDALHGVFMVPNQHADGSVFDPEKPARYQFPEMFRYCFPDVIETVRNRYPYITPRCANYAMVYGFCNEMEIRYDADVDDVRKDTYAEWNTYAARISDLRRRYRHVLGEGTFTDENRVHAEGTSIIAKGYEKENLLAAAVWNDTPEEAELCLTVPGYRLIEYADLDGTASVLPKTLKPQQAGLALYERLKD